MKTIRYTQFIIIFYSIICCQQTLLIDPLSQTINPVQEDEIILTQEPEKSHALPESTESNEKSIYNKISGLTKFFSYSSIQAKFISTFVAILVFIILRRIFFKIIFEFSANFIDGWNILFSSRMLLIEFFLSNDIK